MRMTTGIPARDAGMTEGGVVVFVTGFYDDVDRAKDDYQVVKDLHYDNNVLGEFDSAVVGRQDSGDVKIFKKHDQPTRCGRLVGAGWGLAIGLAVALFPAAATGTGLLDGSGHLRRVHSAWRGSRQCTWAQAFAGSWRELGRRRRGLVVAADPEIMPAMQRMIGGTESVQSQETMVNIAHLERVIRDAWREAVA